MPRVALNDTNILIDFYEIGLLSQLMELNIEMHTTDFVVFEVLQKAQSSLLDALVDSKKLTVNSFAADEFPEILEKENNHRGLSFTDCSAWHWAEQNQAILLTGDAKMRRAAEQNDVEVHGSLWLLDEMVAQDILSKKEAYDSIRLLQEKNRRLPKKECEQREKLWSKG